MDYRFTYRHADRVKLPAVGLELWPCHVYELFAGETLQGRLYIGSNYCVVDLPDGPLRIDRAFHFWKSDRIRLVQPFSGEEIGQLEVPGLLRRYTVHAYWGQLTLAGGTSYRLQQLDGYHWFWNTRPEQGIYDLSGPHLHLTYHGRFDPRYVRGFYSERQLEGFIEGMGSEHLLPCLAGFYLIHRGMHWHERASEY